MLNVIAWFVIVMAVTGTLIVGIEFYQSASRLWRQERKSRNNLRRWEQFRSKIVDSPAFDQEAEDRRIYEDVMNDMIRDGVRVADPYESASVRRHLYRCRVKRDHRKQESWQINHPHQE